MTNGVEKHIDQLTNDILASYQKYPDLQRVGEDFLPSRGTIIEIIETIRQLLFPGFFGHKRLSQQTVRYHVGNLISRLSVSLNEQICHCRCYSKPCPDRNACDKKCGGIAEQFIQRIPKLREALALDAQAAYDGDPAARSLAEIVYSYPGFLAVTVYRIAHELLELQVPLMPRIMTEYAHSITGADIHPGAHIGSSFFIDHATGVVIGETSIIGDHVKIYQGVTLGAHSFPKDERGRAIKGLKRHPTIEDNVTIYANATILGGETVIGKNTTIGGNAFVSHSIPENHLVLPEAPEQHIKEKRSTQSASIAKGE